MQKYVDDSSESTKKVPLAKILDERTLSLTYRCSETI